MDRREFIKQMGLGLAAGCFAWPRRAGAAGPELRLALLSDAHLKDGNDQRPEAQALTRAVAEINALSPPPNLVLFAGDLAHRGRPDALELGREILGDLPGPCWAVRGEGDQGPRESAWVQRWGSPRFSRAFSGCHFIGLDTVLSRTRRGPVFGIGAAQCQWLARQLAGLNPATPLVILSHAPLARIFRPWQQWTRDASEITPHLSRFYRVLCLHGHVHRVGVGNAGARGQRTDDKNDDHDGNNSGSASLAENLTHYGLPATSFCQPLPIQGTPAVLRPGRGPRGCGWALITLGSERQNLQPVLWQA